MSLQETGLLNDLYKRSYSAKKQLTDRIEMESELANVTQLFREQRAKESALSLEETFLFV